MSKLARAMVKFSNFVARCRPGSVEPRHLVLLLPRCIQKSGCGQDVVGDTGNCRRCGGCKVGELAALAEELGIRCRLATGGELALDIVRGKDVHGIVAVACEKELRAGILRTFPKRVIAVVNMRPNGPCRDTDVDVAAVRDALNWLIGKSAGETP